VAGHGASREAFQSTDGFVEELFFCLEVGNHFVDIHFGQGETYILPEKGTKVLVEKSHKRVGDVIAGQSQYP